MTPEDKAELEKLRQQLADEEGVPVSAITAIACGTNRCDHDSDGPWIEEGNFVTASCSKCGSRAIDRAMWGDR